MPHSDYSALHGKNIKYCNKNRTICCKNCFQKVVDKTPEAKGEVIGNKIVEKLVKPKAMSDRNSINAEGIVIPPEKIMKILNEF